VSGRHVPAKSRALYERRAGIMDEIRVNRNNAKLGPKNQIELSLDRRYRGRYNESQRL